MEVKPGYKQTEIGVIPEDWDFVQLKNCIDLKNGYAFQSVYFSDRGEVLLTPGNFSRTGGLQFDSTNTKQYNGKFPKDSVLSYGDLLLVMTDLTPDCKLLGKPAIVKTKEPLLHNQRIAKVVNNQRKAVNGFLFYVFLSEHYLRYLKDRATGSTVRHTSLRIISSFRTALPPKKEQIAVSKTLSDIDSLITSIEKLIEKKKLIKQGVMQELLTGKRRIPGFSGEWETKRLGNICEIMKGSGLSKSSLSDDGSSYCILYGELFTKYNELIENPVSKTDSTQGLLSQTGDVLLPGSTTTTGIDLAKASSLMSDDVRIGGDINVLRPLEGIYGPYLALQINTVLRNRIAEKTKGITIHHLHGKDMIDIVVNVPSLEEQVQISQTINSIERDLFKLHFKHLKLSYLKQAMMQELLTGRIRLI